MTQPIDIDSIALSAADDITSIRAEHVNQIKAAIQVRVHEAILQFVGAKHHATPFVDTYGTGVKPWNQRLTPENEMPIVTQAMQAELDDLREIVAKHRVQTDTPAAPEPSLGWKDLSYVIAWLQAGKDVKAAIEELGLLQRKAMGSTEDNLLPSMGIMRDSTAELRYTLREIPLCYPHGTGITLSRTAPRREWSIRGGGILKESENNLVNSAIAATTALIASGGNLK